MHDMNATPVAKSTVNEKAGSKKNSELEKISVKVRRREHINDHVKWTFHNRQTNHDGDYNISQVRQ